MDLNRENRFNIADWHRVEFQDIPIYFRRDDSDWFVPNKAGDSILQELKHDTLNAREPQVLAFLQRLPSGKAQEFQGRADYLRLENIHELWFHLTNQCNLSCSHCLFSSSPRPSDHLTAQQVLSIAQDASELGCSLFVLTGGEPFVHPQISDVIHGLLHIKESHVVILSNGIDLPDFLFSPSFDTRRVHLQISIDGMKERHDHIRGRRSFEAMNDNLDRLRKHEIPFTLSMCVTKANVDDMPSVVDFSTRVGAGNVHFMWYFVRGRGKTEGFVPVDDIFRNLIEAADRAHGRQIRIDNIESLKTQIFAPRGTVHDGSTAAWESLAVGPDGMLYPSAALVGIPELSTSLSQGIENAWRHSPVLKEIRDTTSATLSSPFRFLLGGGDIDHSYIHNKTFMGDDPFEPLLEKMTCWLIARHTDKEPNNEAPRMRLQMGEILESCGAHGKVALTHSNCLLAFAGQESLTVVKTFYAEAVGDQKEEILNPVCYDSDLIDHIPQQYRFRGYGCGSPVLDADIQPKEQVVDLGCGSGVECFIAARLTGSQGRVTGIDMLDPMLALAREARKGVIKNLGYDNIQFHKAYLEDLPIENNSVDLVTSNCVMNLSVHKRRAYSEIFRILRPGGRLVISDVVCEREPDPAIRNNETLRGECIAGAMTQIHLTGLLEAIGFSGIQIIKRFPYRIVAGHPFFSLTYRAFKPESSEKVQVIYRGPLPNILTHDGTLLLPGAPQTIPSYEARLLGDQVLVLDESGNVLNVEAENSCSCLVMPEQKDNIIQLGKDFKNAPFMSGCMLCGSPIEYLPEEKECRCEYCGRTSLATALCNQGHYVCDDCHMEDGLKIISHICATTQETDMICLFRQIRRHPSFPVHGLEHHALVPGVILATYRNLGGDIPASSIQRGIQRGSTVAGGYCAFMGICGAAVGVGIAFSQILDATPIKPKERKTVQDITHEVLGEIARFRAARCCQRDAWLALKKAADLSLQYLPVPLQAKGDLVCTQKNQNKECLGKGCPLYYEKSGQIEQM